VAVSCRLNDLEVAALAAIAGQYPEQEAGLLAQIQAAGIVTRENTGAGFFTHLSVDRSSIKPVCLRSPFGDAWADIDGFLDPMGFLVFLREGYICTLEGFAIRDHTSGTDFNQVRFSMRPDGPMGIVGKRD
jgi:hypothetical protein